jgi:ketosteroid isomerase-like protein
LKKGFFFSMNDNTEAKQIVSRFWAAMHANDFEAAGALLHDEYVLDWPQSGERIRGRANFVAVNAHYPAAGRWHITLDRLLAEGDQAASQVTVTDGVLRARAITFSTVRDGLIVRQTEYWPDPFPAAAWRARWVERADAT